MAGISTGNRALKGRSGRRLPPIELPRSDNPSIQRAFESINEHLRVYEGDGTAPKERFVTLRELEEAGLISAGVKNGYSYISQILNKDVAQKAGSTANPTLKGSIKKDTALGPRTPGGGGAGSSNPIEAGKRSRVNKLSDIENVKVASPAQADFLYYDGGKWKNYSLFKRENRWLKTQNFAAGIETASLSIAGVTVDLSAYLTESSSPTLTGAWDFSGASGLTLTEASVTAHEAALTIAETQITDGTLLARVADAETITGSWTFSGQTYFTEASYAIRLQSAAPKIWFYESDAAADQGKWDIVAAGEQLRFRLGTDAESFTDWMTVDRTGVTTDSVKFAGPIYPGTSTGYIGDVTGGYGSVEVGGAEGGATWEGVNIAGRAVFMWNTSEERGGIYDDVNNRWALQWNPSNDSGNEELWLYNGSVVVAKTKQYTATGQTSSMNVLGHGGTERPVGFNTLPTFNLNASDTLEARHCGKVTGKTNTTSYTLTGPTSSDVDFPVGGVCTIMNLGSSTNYNLADTATCTMYVLDGSSATDIAGAATVAPGGTVTLWRYSTTAIYLFGSGLTA